MSRTIPYITDATDRSERMYDIYSRLLKDRIICLYSQIDEYSGSNICAQLLALGKQLVPLITDIPALLAEYHQAKQALLFEGAQGTFLDIDQGTYPYVTSSNTIATLTFFFNIFRQSSIFSPLKEKVTS